MRVLLRVFLILSVLSSSFVVFSTEKVTAEDQPNYLSQGLIRFWQKVISPADGPRSPSFPSGSRYARDAFQRYNFFYGMILTADRLIHESEVHHGEYIRVGNERKFYDPLINNTYWWDENYLKEVNREIDDIKKIITENERVYSRLEIPSPN